MRHAAVLACALLLLGASGTARADEAPAPTAVPDHKPPPPATAHRSRAEIAQHKRHTAKKHAARHSGPREVGVASWYGTRQTIGHRTASGERFDPNRLTAAHPTLPMNTKVRVKNLANGRSVTVRINDRGPEAKDRIIDLSPRAAELLGMKRRGVARVAVMPLPSSSASSPTVAGP